MNRNVNKLRRQRYWRTISSYFHGPQCRKTIWKTKSNTLLTLFQKSWLDRNVDKLYDDIDLQTLVFPTVLRVTTEMPLNYFLWVARRWRSRLGFQLIITTVIWPKCHYTNTRRTPSDDIPNLVSAFMGRKRRSTMQQREIAWRASFLSQACSCNIDYHNRRSHWQYHFESKPLSNRRSCGTPTDDIYWRSRQALMDRNVYELWVFVIVMNWYTACQFRRKFTLTLWLVCFVKLYTGTCRKLAGGM